MKIPSSEISLDRIVNYINKTPLIKSDRLSSKNQNVFFKLESFQKTGSFKVRGALNKVYSTDFNSEIVAASSGNHGAAVSYALKTKNISGKIYVPQSAKKSQIDKIKSLTIAPILHLKCYPCLF